jgi:hypothetical protein
MQDSEQSHRNKRRNEAEGFGTTKHTEDTKAGRGRDGHEKAREGAKRELNSEDGKRRRDHEQEGKVRERRSMTKSKRRLEKRRATPPTRV